MLVSGISLRYNGVKRLLFTTAVLAFAVALYDLVIGGFHYTIAGLRLSSWDAFKPAAIGILATGAAWWRSDRTRTPTTWERVGRAAPRLAAAASALTIVAGIHWGTFVAGAADQYGYVSEARRWAEGQLIVPEPLARDFPALDWALTPLGYRPVATVPKSNVPTYPPGLPLAMALAERTAGPNAVYVVVPILGGLAVWLTFILGWKVAGPRTGLAAAILVGCSPIFLFQLVEPMSDVPATACWLLALALACSEMPVAALFAGLAASAAVLTRPNLVPLAVVIAAFLLTGPQPIQRAALFGAGVVPGCLALGFVNRYLYGSPLATGYPGLGSMFAWGNLRSNLDRYPIWMMQGQSAAILLAFGAPLAIRRHSAEDEGIREPALAWLFLVFIVVLFASYLFYTPFNGWPFLRFLLPAIPLLLVLATAVVFRVASVVPRSSRGALLFSIFALGACWYVHKAFDVGVFYRRNSEHRYASIGEYVARTFPPNAALLSMQESGSLRFYGHRLTIRWDLVPIEDLDEILNALEAKGYVVYFALEDWEEPEFRARYAHSSPIGRLDWPPAVEYLGEPGVRIYRRTDRVRYLAGKRILTEPIPES
jgi:hypothetical protein